MASLSGAAGNCVPVRGVRGMSGRIAGKNRAEVPDWCAFEGFLTPDQLTKGLPPLQWCALLKRADRRLLDLTARSLGFYLYSVFNGRDDGETFLSQRTMATETGWSRPTVIRSLGRLSDCGWVQLEDR